MKLFWSYIKMWIPVFIFLNIVGFYGFWEWDIGAWDGGRWGVVFFTAVSAMFLLGFTFDNDKKLKQLDIDKLNAESRKLKEEKDVIKAKDDRDSRDYAREYREREANQRIVDFQNRIETLEKENKKLKGDHNE